MTFLERAQEIYDKRGPIASSILMQDCWPELLDVVEAAERHAGVHAKDGSDCDELADALDALDRKVGE